MQRLFWQIKHGNARSNPGIPAAHHGYVLTAESAPRIHFIEPFLNLDEWTQPLQPARILAESRMHFAQKPSHFPHAGHVVSVVFNVFPEGERKTIMQMRSRREFRAR